MGMQMQDNQIVADDDGVAGADDVIVAHGQGTQNNQIVADDDVQAQPSG
jgi:hypothetical protein